jgi:iron complex outermembrane receptor protein
MSCIARISATNVATGQFSAARQRGLGVLLLCCLAFSTRMLGQTPAPAAPPQQPGQTPAAQQKPSTPPVQPVTTTVVVHGKANDDYLPDTVTVGTLDGASLQETPLSATVVTHDLLLDQGARLLSDIVKNDASIGEDYAPVGYYGDYEIRGFAIDLATGLQINGMAIAGEQDVPLENKERVELLKGIAGIESGVAAAGGLINYVTRMPATVKDLDLATDHRGSAYGAVDLGVLFGGQKEFGLRSSLGGERIATYVKDANGWRALGTASADWKMSPKAILKGDFEYQHKVERSVCGYQLLGGTTVPDISSISPSTMLGEQIWEKPNTFDTLNSGARFDYDLPRAWHAFAAASYSHSLIDDNVVYAYGCYYQPLCTADGGSAPSYFFAPDGGYDIYDYRDPGELRIDAQAEALVTGHIKTGPISQDLAAGGELFRRSVRQPGYYTADNPYDPNGVFQNGAVYTWVGSDNIYQPIAPVDLSVAEDPHQSAGPVRLWEDGHQSAAIVQDRIHLPGHVQLVAAGRYDWLHDHNYSLAATEPGVAPILTDRPVWLPQFAALFNPTTSLTLYANYGVLLSLGPQSPFWTDNSSQFLSSFLSRQAEIGAKFLPSQRLLITTALFHMRAPFFYPRVLQQADSFCPASEFNAPGDLCFEQQGRETHDGIEVNAEGKAANWLRLTASAAAIRAISSDTLTPAFDNKQVLNVPHLRATAFADVALPHLGGLHLMPGWSYTGRKEATRDDAVSVPGYNIFNLGARYSPGGEQGRMTFRIYADNIADKRYWKDTGASLGDTFIHLGAPTTVRLSAHYTF